jgi:hypothetical protein
MDDFVLFLVMKSDSLRWLQDKTRAFAIADVILDINISSNYSYTVST